MKQRSALVTGASRGIGAAIAEGLAEDGISLIGLHYRENDEAAAETSHRLERHGARVVLLRYDLAVSPEETAGQLASAFLDGVENVTGNRTLDVLVNNAGTAHHGRFEDVDEACLLETMELNVASPMFLIRALMPNLSRGGRVINISTGLSRVAAPYQVPYVAMKAALNSVTLSLAPILGAQDVTINAVMPGYVETDRMQESFARPGRRELVSSLSVFNRIGAPDDVAQMVRYLCLGGFAVDHRAGDRYHRWGGTAWRLAVSSHESSRTTWKECGFMKQRIVQQRAQETRDDILNSAGRHFNSNGYAPMTLAEVCSEAGVTTGSVYFHFGSKEELARAVLTEFNIRMQHFCDQVVLRDGPALESMVYASLMWGHLIVADPIIAGGVRLSIERPDLLSASAAAYDPWSVTTETLLVRARDAGEVASFVDVVAASRYLMGSFIGAQILSRAFTRHEDFSQRLVEMWEYALSGLLPRSDSALIEKIIHGVEREITSEIVSAPIA